MRKTIISIFIIFTLVISVPDLILASKAMTYGDNSNYVVRVMNADNKKNITFTGKVILSMNFRVGPGMEFGRVLDYKGKEFKLPKGQRVTIVGCEHDSAGGMWYKVTLKYKKHKYTGYVYDRYIEIDLPKSSVDKEFEKYMDEQGFPKSYRPYLRFIHINHPGWKFVAVDTGLAWKDVVANECNKNNSEIKSTIWTDSESPNYNWRSTTVKYNIEKNRWTVCDGDNWFAASDEVVKYYLDPRIYLDERHVFAFESLSYKKGIHSRKGVNEILEGTFMAKNNKAFGDSRTYSEIIMLAARRNGVSPYHIASRIRLEMGVSAGAAADGSYNGCYNYFNIGAIDGYNATIAGLNYAAENGSYGRPWNTVEKSIVGGTRYLKAGYIGLGQNTLYTQRFNVVNRDSLYEHQYCTNVQMPYREAETDYAAYYNMGALDSAIVFEIPVYSGLPDKTYSLPQSEGNPNAFLKSLSVGGYKLTPNFKVSKRVSYSLTVPTRVRSVKITANAVYKKAKVIGTGRIKLRKGKNIVYIYCKSESGNIRKYKVTIIRGTDTGKKYIHNPKITGK